MLLALSVLGCNRYELFVIDGGRGASGNDADVLFVIDNSDSMYDETVALAENFAAFVQALAGRDEAVVYNGLPDSVDRYVDYVQDPGLFVDFQLAITTIDVRAGDAGALRGNPVLLPKGMPGLADAFIENLVCDAACFADRRLVPADPAFTCGDAFEGAITQQYLDCLCGEDAWVGHCGGGTEEGLEAVYAAMCRAVDEPPEACFDERSELGPLDRNSSPGLLRPGATLIPVIVTDEGDTSRRQTNVDAFPGKYLQLFDEIGVNSAWAVIGPGLDENSEVRCPGPFSWGVQRYDYLVQATGGIKLDIHDGACGPADWASALDQLGRLVGGGISAYTLPQRPNPASIVVELDERVVERSRDLGEDLFGRPSYSDGWSYDAETWTVHLHGAAKPAVGEQVRIYYHPARER